MKHLLIIPIVLLCIGARAQTATTLSPSGEVLAVQKGRTLQVNHSTHGTATLKVYDRPAQRSVTGLKEAQAPELRVWVEARQLHTEFGQAQPGRQWQLRLVDASGREVWQRQVSQSAGVQRFALPQLSSGTYIYQLRREGQPGRRGPLIIR